MVGEYKIQIDRQPWHVADEQVDRSAALEGESAVREDERGDLRQQASCVQDVVHGLSTNSPSPERDTQGRSLPVGSCAGSNLVAQGRASSRPS